MVVRMSNATIYGRIAGNEVPANDELSGFNLILDRLEQISRDLNDVTARLDQMRMEKENALRGQSQ